MCANGTEARAVSMRAAGSVALVLAAALVTGISAEAWPADQEHHAAAPAAQKGADGTTATGPNMMAMRQKMMADHIAADARLQRLLDEMNAAKGEGKIEAMAAVMVELVGQRAAMRGPMAEPCPMMNEAAAPTQKP